METTLVRRTRFGLFFVILAMLLVGIAVSAPGADAKPNNGTNKQAHQIRGDNFAEGCGNAGGNATILESNDPKATHVRCDFGDYAVSCVFTDQYSGKLDVCVDSRGIQHAPLTVLTNLGNLSTATATEVSGSTTSRGQSGRVSVTFETQKER